MIKFFNLFLTYNYTYKWLLKLDFNKKINEATNNNSNNEI